MPEKNAVNQNSLKFVILSLILLCSSANAQDPQLLCHYGFDGNVENSFGGNSRFRVDGPTSPIQFVNNALVSQASYPNDCCFIYSPDLNCDHFTVAMKFKIDPSSQKGINILSAGRALRWFRLYRTLGSAKLAVSFNNGRLKNQYPVTVARGKWNLVVCSIDLEQKTVRMHYNGNDYPPFQLPEDFLFTQFTPEWEKYANAEKTWSFTNYSNGHSLVGLVDELALFNSVVEPEAVEKCFELNRMARVLFGNMSNKLLVNTSNAQINQLDQEESLRQIQRRMESKLSPLGFDSSEQGIGEYLDFLVAAHETSGLATKLVSQLGADSYQIRNEAEFRLRALGSVAAKHLEAARANNRDAEARYRMLRTLRDIKIPQFQQAEPVLDYLSAHPNHRLVPALISNLEFSDCAFDRIRLCETLLACAGPENQALLRDCLGHSSKWVRLAAICCLENISNDDALANWVIPLLSDEDELVQICAAGALSKIDPAAAQATLTGIAQSENWQVKYLAKRIESRCFQSR